MDNAITISLGNLEQNSKNFGFLRQRGMQLIQQLAPATWTDHNLHDPGITLLEALCYATTEAGMQAGAASKSDTTEDVFTYMANLLSSGQATAPQDFFTAAQVLPSSPVSLTDFQKVLLDNPLIKRAWVSVVDGVTKGDLSALQQFNTRVDNVIASSVIVAGTNYTIDFIFPPWNDPSVRPLQSDLLLQTVGFANPATPWQQIPGADTYAALIDIQYLLRETAAPILTLQLMILLQITTPLTSPAHLPLILQAAAAQLLVLGDNSALDNTICKHYNHRLVAAGDENNDPNSNILGAEVTVAAKQYKIEIAFPYWDDPETAPFQNDVTITNLIFNPPVNPWKQITGTDSYFTFLNFQWNGNPVQWPLVLRIVSPMDGVSPIILNDILIAAATALNTPAVDPLLLKQYNQKVMMAFESSHRIQAYLKNYRNLCESFSAYRSVRIQEIAISCSIEMGAGTDIELLLAKIFYSIYCYISPQPTHRTLPDLRDQLATESIFEGPLLGHGFIEDADLGSNLPSNILYVSDVVRLIMQMGTGADIQSRQDEENRPLISVSNVTLALFIDNRSITTRARDCLQLINSTRYIPQLSLDKCNIVVTRNNTSVSYDLNRLLDLYTALVNAGNFSDLVSEDLVSDMPIPIGEVLPIGQYYSVQNDLPPTYGIGKAGLPAASSAQRRAQARQLQGYLFLFEQVLAGYFTQLAHVNTLFSANAQATTTLYQLPLYNIPAAQDLLLPLSGYPSWASFIADDHNAYRQVLTNGPETQDQFLTRRHQMLDHLLARLGEDMQAFSALIYRQSYSNPASLITSASKALLQYKADYYYALPDLARDRAQAYGHPAWRNKSLIHIDTSPDGAFFTWQITDGNGNILFRQSVPETTRTAAQDTAEAAMVLATAVSNYTNAIDLNGNQKLSLNWAAGQPPIAISEKIYATPADATTGIPTLSQTILDLWVKYSLSSLEARLYHLLAITIKGERRKLINPIADFFDITDAAIPPPFNKTFHLRSTANPASAVLLNAQHTYIDASEPTAIALANAGIDQVIQAGIAPGNYIVDATFSVSLLDLAKSPAPYASDAAARAAITQIQQLLYRYYSHEGFYIIEHNLLAPVTSADTQLVFPDIATSCLPVSATGLRYSLPKDPYSFICTIAFPSGYARDFSDTSATPLKTETQPGRFRSLEFRQYAEQTIGKYCPAHILPLVVWVDTALPGTPLKDGSNKYYPCFDNVESAYMVWLAAYFTDNEDPTVIAPLRNDLVSILNDIFQM